MNQAYIFLGTNIDPKKNYLEALRRLAELGRLVSVSSVYETAPIGSCCENYYNGAVLLRTELCAPELKRALRELEHQMGRVRTTDRNAPRPIDLDLVLYNHDRIDNGALHLPDPLILQRPFMAQALAELAPDYVHPVEGRTLARIADSLRPEIQRRPVLAPYAQGQSRDGTPAWAEATMPVAQIQPEMTARARNFLNQLSTGENICITKRN